MLTSTNGARFVGFRVLNQDEYIVSATFSANSGFFTSLDQIMFGDDSPQNVALNFDGVNDYVEIPSNVGNFGTNDNFTVSCWFKPDPSANGEQELIGKWNFSSGTNFAFTIRYNSANGTTYAGQFADPTFSTVGSSTDLRDGKWHHIAFTKNASVLELVVDGVSAGTGTDNATGVTTNGLPLNIGRRGGSGSNYFKGEIDEVRIWTVGKDATQILNEMLCKTPDPMDLQASYSFSNGVPHDNNPLITQIQDAVSTNHGTLNNFAKTGDASNFVTGQVKYVKLGNHTTKNGSSWANAFAQLKLALPASNCNDLFDVYVAKGTHLPDYPTNFDVNASFNIPSGMRIYGGFAGTEKSINQRNRALIHSTNETTLSGDLNGNDTPFNFTTNRGENSTFPVKITGNNVVFDGFTVRGARVGGAGGIRINGTNVTIKNSRMIDNSHFGLEISGDNATIANCSIMGNKDRGISIENSSASIKESLIANNGLHGIDIFVNNGTRQTSITNSTIASNADYGINVVTSDGTSTNTLKNTLIYGNASGGIFNDNSFGGTITNTITYSLVQGVTTGTGNLNGNTVNPQFVSAVGSGIRSDLGDYRLK